MAELLDLIQMYEPALRLSKGEVGEPEVFSQCRPVNTCTYVVCAGERAVGALAGAVPCSSTGAQCQNQIFVT
jgi:hypothetical protein